jgi:hypothetical protein
MENSIKFENLNNQPKGGIRGVIEKGIDLVFDYPGSKKRNEWYVTDWVEAKVDQFMTKGGTERR